jgi:hypothetical protein
MIVNDSVRLFESIERAAFARDSSDEFGGARSMAMLERTVLGKIGFRGTRLGRTTLGDNWQNDTWQDWTWRNWTWRNWIWRNRDSAEHSAGAEANAARQKSRSSSADGFVESLSSGKRANPAQGLRKNDLKFNITTLAPSNHACDTEVSGSTSTDFRLEYDHMKPHFWAVNPSDCALNAVISRDFYRI